jgi:hypothetical protein
VANDNKGGTSGFTPEQMEQFTKMLSEAMQKGMTEGMAMGMAMASKQQAEAQAAKDRMVNEVLERRQKSACAKCGVPYEGCGGPEYVQAKDANGQLLFQKDKDGKDVLKDGQKVPVMEMVAGEDKNHMLMEIWAHDRHETKFFGGIKISGKLFRSNGPGHRILVPRNSELPYILNQHLRVQEDQRMGKKASNQVGYIDDSGRLNAVGRGQGGNFSGFRN